jgi:CRP/FNR family transcriptional regulator, cyclic AMP receptor protein
MSEHAGRESALHERFARAFPAGTVLFREGDPGFDMFVIHVGRVQLTRHLRQHDVTIAVLHPGEFFGEMAIVNNRPRSATATCLDHAELLVIDQRTFEAMIRRNAEIAVRLIRKLAERLDRANAQIEMLLLKDINHRLVLHLRRTAEEAGAHEGAGLRVQERIADIADHIGVDVPEVEEALDRLAQARLLLREPGGGVLISEVGRLDDFLAFLDMKERFGELP